MNRDFTNGFLLGTWLSGDRNSSSGDGNGCGCGCLIAGIIGLLLLSALFKLGMTIVLKVTELLKHIEGLFEETTNTIITKIIFFPSTYDLIFELLNDSYFFKIFLLIGTIIGLIFLVFLINTVFPNNFGAFFTLYVLLNGAVLIVRTFYFIGMTVVAFFVGEDYDFNYAENDQIHFNVLENNHQLKYRYLISEEYPMPDANNETHEGILWVEFMSGNLDEEVVFNTHLLMDGMAFKEVSQATLFTTTLSYIPIGSESSHTNLSAFKVEFIGDSKVLHATEISPDKPIEEVSFGLNGVNELELKISSQLVDRSIIGLLDPLFIKEN